MKKVLFAVTLLYLAVIGVSFSTSAYGAGLYNPLGCETARCVTDKIADFLLAIGGPIAVIMVLVGGFQMMTAAGNPEQFSTGKKTLLYAAIGLVVILAAKSVPVIISSIFE
ncbi:MAG: pilin [Patescibacteria group bacterium]